MTLPRLIAILATLIAAGCASYALDPPPARVIEADAEAVADETIVVIVGTRDAESNLVARAKRRGYRLKARNRLTGLGYTLLSFAAPQGVSRDAAIRELERMEPRATAGANHRYRIQSSVDSLMSEDPQTVRAASERRPPARRYADALMQWPEEGCLARHAVGIIDTPPSAAFLRKHGASIVERPLEGLLVRSHARAHADDVGALILGKGRLRNVRLYSAAVVSEDDAAGAGVVDLVRALDWMKTEGVGIVNISLAGPYNKILDRAFRRAIDRSMVVVAAAGNDGPNSPPRYPAALKGVIAVTAVDGRLAPFKDAVRGEHIDFAAPGVDVYVEAGEDGRFVSGTSIAAPFVTARLAAEPAIASPADANATLSADAVDIGAPGRDPVFGFGMVLAPPTCRA